MPIRKVKEFVQHNNLTRTERGRNDIWVPDEKRSPHIHIGRRFITFKKRQGNQAYLIEGDTIYEARTQQVLDDCDNDEVVQICRYILDELA